MICMGKCQHFLHPMYETDTLSHLTHWTEWTASGCVSFLLRMHTIFPRFAQPHDSPLSLLPDNKAKMGREAAHYPPQSCDPADWIFFEEYNSGNSPLIGFLTHIWLIFLCRQIFHAFAEASHLSKQERQRHLNIQMWGALSRYGFLFHSHNAHQGEGCVHPQGSLFFPLTVWLAEWKIANIRFDLAVRVFVVLIAKYVAIYALCYIMSAMYLCCCIRETHFRTLWDSNVKAKRRHA